MGTILIDGDICVYRAACAAENRYYLAKHTGNLYELKKDVPDHIEVTLVRFPKDNIVAMETIETTIYGIRQQLGFDLDYTVYISGKGNFRKDITDTYKANRKDIPKPEHYTFCRQYLAGNHPTVLVDYMEADDALGIAQTEDTIIASIDKDLLTIPGRHYNITTKVQSTVSETEAFYNFCSQMLTGDTVDNIKGVRGIGKVRAARILENRLSKRDMWASVIKAYRKHGSELGMELTANLLWILRDKYRGYNIYINEVIKNENISKY